MKMSVGISLLCVSVFGVCGLMFGLLDFCVRVGGEKSAERELAVSAAVAAANFGASDSVFSSSEKLAAASKRAGLESLEVVFVKPDVGLFSENPKVSDLGADGLSARFSAKTCDGLVARATVKVSGAKYCEIKSGVFALIGLWTLSGMFFGAAAASVLSFVLRRKLAALRASISGGVPERNLSIARERFEISEFSDLGDTSRLLRLLNKTRSERECKMLDAYGSNFDLEESALAATMPCGRFDFACGRATAEFSYSRADGSFFAKLHDDRILYGRVDIEKDSVRKLSSALFARDVSANFLRSLDPWRAFVEASKIFPFTHWNVLSFSENFTLREGIENGEWSSEKFSSDDSALFSTVNLGSTLRFYARLDLSKDADRLKTLMSLSSENLGGLFILIDGKHDAKKS